MKEEITFVMDGPAFDEGFPLHTVLTGLNELQAIIDKTFLVLSGRQRVTTSDRDSYKIVAQSFKKGSFCADLEIYVAAIQAVLPWAVQIDPKNILGYTKDTLSLLKTIFQPIKEGQTPKITQNENGTVTVINGGVTNTFNGPVIQIAGSALPNYQNLTKLLEGGVDSIYCGEAKNKEEIIALEKKDVKLFSPPNTITTETINVDCEIFDFNKYKNMGKLSVAPNQKMTEGEYSFSVIGDQDYKQYVHSMLKTKVTVNCLQEVTVNPFGKSNVVKLQIVKISA
jgi:hypothetical protein